jgi:indolepyruvate ferredoxin oxidoreductase alpha subunit
MVSYAFDLSEKYGVPVLMRLTTRLAHSRSGIVRSVKRKQNSLKLPHNLQQYVLLPAIARKQYKKLIEHQPDFREASVNSPFNKYFEGKDKSLGIIASGIAYNYLMENFQDKELGYPVLKISQYPLPGPAIRKMVAECNELLILEDGYPMIEESLRGFLDDGIKIKGRMDGTLQFDGELNPGKVADALGFPYFRGRDVPQVVTPRPPALCSGCPHIDSFLALNVAIEKYSKGRVFSDIGCYTIGALKPFESINSCVDMGASITMAKGAADAGLIPAVAVIGDSTFTHSGMTGLLDCVKDKSNVTIIILDNSTTAMTGGQPSPGEGRLADIVKGLGVEEEHIRIIKPLRKNHVENYKIIEEELDYNGVSVILPTRECIVQTNKRMREKFKNR